MASDDLSLLFRLKGDAASLKQATAESRAAVNQLKQSFGPELTQTVTVANKAFNQISDNLTQFAGQRIPLVGGAFVRITENLRGFSAESGKTERAVASLAGSIQSLAQKSGKTTGEITSFLRSFVQLATPAARNEAAFKAFGGSVDLVGNKTAKFLPELEQAGTAMAAMSVEATSAAASLAALAGPAALAAAAIGAQVAVVVTLTKEIFELAKASAEYQGKLFDLSQQVGVSVETLSALEVAARKTGGSIESVTQSLGIFQRKLEEATEDESSKAAISFRKLGVETRNTEDALVQTVAALARMPEGFRQTATALELFGRGGKAVLAIAKESNGDIGKLRDSLRGLGGVTTEQARIADEFNDKLVDLDIALRGLGTQAIPVVLDVLRDLSTTLKENRELFNILQGIIKAVALSISLPLKAALNGIRIQLNNVEPILRVTVELFERLAQAIGFISAHPVNLPQAGETGQAAPAGATDQRDPFIESTKDEIEARKQLQGVLNVAFAERQRQAEASIALAQREFEAGQRTRQQLLDATIEGTRKQTQAEIDALNVDRKIKLAEQALAKDDLEKQSQLSNQILAIDTQIANKRAAQRVKEADLRAKSQLDERRATLAHQQADLDTLTKAGQQRIAIIEQQIQLELIDREEGLRKIEAIENATLQARGQLLKRELELAGVGPERQVVLDKIKALETERTALERAQSERRIALAEAEAQRLTAIALSTAESISAAAQIGDEARIARVRALAVLRVQTEEQAERAILRIKLDALAREDELARIRRNAAEEEVKARIKAVQDQRAALTTTLEQTTSIADRTALTKQITALVDLEVGLLTSANVERNRLDQELNNQLRVNSAQRTAITEQGNRDIDDARQKDLDNEREYADDLEEAKQRTHEAELDAAEEVIRLMESTFARRRDIIRAERDLDLAREADRHRRETEKLNRQKQETDAEIAALEKRLERLVIGTTEEIEEHDRLIASLERLRAKRAELDAQQDAEDSKSATRKRRTTTDADAASTEAGPFGGFNFGLQTGQLVDLANGVTEFSDVAKVAFSAVGAAANQMANAVGNAVEAFVLYGSAGTSVRKVTAEILASIAKQATVKALFEVAEGLAALALAFFGLPNAGPSASAHFAAAAAYGAIAGVTALVGRSVAGDLFKPQNATSNGSNRAGGSGSSARESEPRPFDLARQQQTINVNIIVHGEPGPGFNQEVVRAVVHDVSVNGPTRDVMTKAAGG